MKYTLKKKKLTRFNINKILFLTINAIKMYYPKQLCILGILKF